MVLNSVRREFGSPSMLLGMTTGSPHADPELRSQSQTDRRSRPKQRPLPWKLIPTSVAGWLPPTELVGTSWDVSPIGRSPVDEPFELEYFGIWVAQ